MRRGLERRLEKVGEKVAARTETRDPTLVQIETRLLLFFLYHQILVEHGIDPNDPDADRRLREIEPCAPAETGV